MPGPLDPVAAAAPALLADQRWQRRVRRWVARELSPLLRKHHWQKALTMARGMAPAREHREQKQKQSGSAPARGRLQCR
ncbi:MAG: hypothetical protein ERJ67_10125 [Aphanocapsa feldmannii 277cV]|uniref:Uncharacterized protein n=1 Tax=Aphanocapsa feldmannii 277cV TaxID=2507553 RepID=A0A524RL64_9CHRO|nr:MAG: hypothetical protein ERJ67_10125 [Aphanocapsa feldmannii 277cV]